MKTFSVFADSTTMQYVIYTYMKHLGVRVKEPRSLESKRVRINFLPKIKVQNIFALAVAFPKHALFFCFFSFNLYINIFLTFFRKPSSRRRKAKRR